MAKNISLSRQGMILAQLTRQGRATVDELAAFLDTTPQTVRKDLSALEAENKVMRFHGGATLLAGVEYTGFAVREKIAVEQKERIAQACAAQIPNNVAVVINSGTTTAAVARKLEHHAGLKVVTDSVQIANEIREFPGIEVLVPGGRIRRSDGVILGQTAIDFIEGFRFDIAIIGASAVGRDGALLDYDLSEAGLVKAIIEHSRHVILTVDTSKFDRMAPVKIGQLSQVNTLITDKDCPDALRLLCRESGIRLVET